MSVETDSAPMSREVEPRELLADAFDDLIFGEWKSKDYDRFGTYPEKIFSGRKVNVGEALLTQVQTRSLPALRQQLSALIAALDLRAVDTQSNPKFDDAVEIARRLVEIMRLIHASITSLAPAYIDGFPFPSKVDHDYGFVKRFRCLGLEEKFDVLGRKMLQMTLFCMDFIQFWNNAENRPPALDSEQGANLIRYRIVIVIVLNQMCCLIDDMISWSEQSDFGILQQNWQEQADLLSEALTRVTQKIDYTVKFREEASPIDGDAPGNNQGRNNVGEENGRGRDNGAGDGSEDGDDGSEDGDDQSEDNSESSLEMGVNPYLIPHIQRATALLKLGRIFFCKLLNTPKSKPPFTLRPRLSSHEWVCLKEATNDIDTCILNIVETVVYADDLDDINRSDISGFVKELLHRLDSSMALLAFSLVPIPSRIDSPRPESVFKSWFFALRTQFSVALDRLLEEFNINRNA